MADYGKIAGVIMDAVRRSGGKSGGRKASRASDQPVYTPDPWRAEMDRIKSIAQNPKEPSLTDKAIDATLTHGKKVASGLLGANELRKSYIENWMPARHPDAEAQEGYDGWPSHVPHPNPDNIPQDLVVGGVGAAPGSFRAAQEDGVGPSHKTGSGFDPYRLALQLWTGLGTYAAMRGARNPYADFSGPARFGSGRAVSGLGGIGTGLSIGGLYDSVFSPKREPVAPRSIGNSGPFVPAVGGEAYDPEDDIPGFGYRPQ